MCFRVKRLGTYQLGANALQVEENEGRTAREWAEKQNCKKELGGLLRKAEAPLKAESKEVDETWALADCSPRCVQERCCIYFTNKQLS